MKYLKIVIVVIVIALIAGGATYYFTRQHTGGDIEVGGGDTRDKTIEKDIKEKIDASPANRFCAQEYDAILKRINLFFKDQPTKKKTWEAKLNGAYTTKFIEQANYVFDHKVWRTNDIAIIRKELNHCLSFSPDNAGLAAIKQVLQNYDKLVAFDKQVANACSQKPKCVKDEKYFYMEDNWDIATTKKLLSQIPSATGKVVNSPVYANTRKNKVYERLHKGHKKFIDMKMQYSETKAESFTDSNHKDWESMGTYLSRCFDTYYEQWNESTSYWRQQLASWEPLQ